jgi:hypothetical protein
VVEVAGRREIAEPTADGGQFPQPDAHDRIVRAHAFEVSTNTARGNREFYHRNRKKLLW